MAGQTSNRNAPPVFWLTPLTRRGDEGRRLVIQGFDIPRAGAKKVLIGFVPALVVTIVLWPLFASYSFVAFFLMEIAVYTILTRRSRAGVVMWKHMLNRSRSNPGAVYLGRTVLLIDQPTEATLERRSSAFVAERSVDEAIREALS